MIVPRWEWRTFGDAIRCRRAALRRAGAERHPGERRAYLLSAEATTRVKVRDELMDIKLLERSDADGLEQWKPVAEGRVPARRDATSPTVSRGARRRPCRRSSATPTRWTSSSTSSSRRARPASAVPVHKRRVRYTLGGCMAEVSDVRGGRRDDAHHRRSSPRTRRACVAAVRALGLWTGARTPATRAGSRRSLGFGARRGSPSSTSARTRSSSTSASGARTARWRQRRRPRRGHPARRGLDDVGATRARSRSRGRRRRSPAMVDEARRHGVRGDRRGRAPPGCAAPRNSADVRRRHAGAAPAFASRSISRRGGGAGSPTSRRRPALERVDGSLVVFDTGGGSTQFTFGHADARRRAVQRRRRGGAVHRAVRPRRRRRRRRARRGARRDRRRPGALDGRAAARRAGRAWAAP